MSTTLKKITEFLDLEGLEYLHKEGKQHLRLRMPTRKYMPPGARSHHIDLVIALEEEGCYVKVIAPEVYHFPATAGSFQKLALMQSLLQISLMSKMVQFEYDADDGEIRAIVECTGVWIVNTNIGYNWRIKQLIVQPPPNKDYAFVDDLDDEAVAAVAE